MLFFGILNFVAKIFLDPIFAGVSAIIPGLTGFFSSIITFVGYGLQYTAFFVQLLMIPKALIITVVGLFVGIFSFNLTIRVVGLGMAIYHYFKP